jgi:hypothetical protein
VSHPHTPLKSTTVQHKSPAHNKSNDIGITVVENPTITVLDPLTEHSVSSTNATMELCLDVHGNDQMRAGRENYGI